MALHLWDHFDYTLDDEFLRARAYPVMKDAATLPPRLRLRARRAADDRPDDLPGERLPRRRRARGAVHEPGHGRADHAGAVRPLRRCRRRARARRSVARRGARSARQRLPAPTIGSDGRLLEWSEEVVEWEPGHRHLSHLFGAFPDDQLIADGDARSRRASPSRSSTGWRTARPNGSWSRRGRRWCGPGSATVTAPSSRSRACSPRAPVEPADDASAGRHQPEHHVPDRRQPRHAGGGGRDDRAVPRWDRPLLPALPSTWASGAVSGLRLRGGFEADIEWAAGRLVAARLRSVAGARCEVRSTIPLAVALDGAPVEVEHRDGLLCFDTRPGAIYDVALADRPDGE